MCIGFFPIGLWMVQDQRAKARIQGACTEVEEREFFRYGSHATANGKSSKEVRIND
jgi:hypothetical protein